MRNAIKAAASGLLLSACSVVGVRTVEQAPYQVVRHIGPVEIRSYGPRLAAEVVAGGGEIGARSAGFRQVAAYIFGANRSRATVAMTAPVSQSMSQSVSQPAGSAAIAMTAPVDQAPAAEGEGDGRWRIRFFMPAKYTRDTLPEPTDPGVHIVTVPAQTVAVLRYSGIPTAAAARDAGARLVAALNGSGLRPEGAVMGWFYDPPWTLPPLRRNEAAVAVAAITAP